MLYIYPYLVLTSPGIASGEGGKLLPELIAAGRSPYPAVTHKKIEKSFIISVC